MSGNNLRNKKQCCDGPGGQCRWIYRDEVCGKHPLVVKSLERAMNDGFYGWGNVAEFQNMRRQAAARAAETPAQRAARENAEARAAAEEAERRAAREAEAQQKVVEAHVANKAKKFVDRRTGALKQKIMKECKWAFEPAKNGWPAGCAARLKGACPWIHPDDPEWQEVCDKKAAKKAPKASASRTRKNRRASRKTRKNRSTRRT